MTSGKTMRGHIWLAVLFLSAGATGLDAQQGSSRADGPRLQARRLEPSESIQIDGILGEPAWGDAVSTTDFRQREPTEGEPATETTEVSVLYDGEFIYIGVRAFDSRPDRIVGRQLERDASLGLSRFGPSGGDDAVEIIIDTFHDRRNAYYFATNPRGVEVDGLITDESESPDTNWDGVWEVRAQTDSEGWSAEFAIPLRVLRFPERPDGQVWGFNIQRTVVRKTEQSLWTSWSRDNEGLHRVSHAGELVGLDSLRVRPSFYVKPYVLAETGQDWVGSDGDVEPEGDLGLDAKLGLSSGQVVDLTVNTDFAQVEADDQQVDLTRFNLFFPEKREFFLENAGIFQFGSPQFFGPPEILLFFSRRIGLQQIGFAEAQTVPIIAGGRFTGRVGGQTIGLLNVVTGEQEDLGAPVTNFAVGRIKRDIGRRSYIGAILTHRYEERGISNLATGVDWNLWISQPLVFEGFYAVTTDSRPGGEDQSWRLVLDYTADWFGWFIEHVEIGPEMRPEIGFIRRPDIASTNGSLRFTPRPPIGGLRKIDIFNRFNYVVTPDERQLRDRGWELRVSPQLDSGDELSLSAAYQFQRLESPFPLNGLEVPAGDYEDWTFSASLTSSSSRAISAELSGSTGGFWDGDQKGIGGGLSFNSPHVGVVVSYTHNDIDIPAGAFTTDLVRGRLKLALNTRLFGNALVQYNSQNGAFSTNLRVDFIHRPGSDLFIVFNEQRDVVDGSWNEHSRAFIVKLTYLHWF